MTRKQAFIIADWMVQLSIHTFAKDTSSKEYVRRRSRIIESLMVVN